MIKRLPSYQELKNSMNAIQWNPGMAMEFLNSNGDIATSSLGYQYTIQTTTLIRAKTIEQKFYKVAPAEFVPVEVGEGAFLEDIKTNLVYDAAGDFESGIVSVADPTNIAQVSAGLAPVTSKIVTWNKGYQYSNTEIAKALAADNWDVVAAKLAVLKRNWDLGIQKVCFLGLASDPTNVPGLLTNTQVTANTTTIPQAISAMDPDDFATFVKLVVSDYFSNSNSTELPDTFEIPMSDFLGLSVPVSPQFPMISKLEYLRKSFQEICGPGFQIKGLAYGDQANNAGYVSASGKNRYVLYRKDPSTLLMTIPVDIILNAPNTSNNYNWEGVGVGQFTGVTIFRPAEVLYFDWSV